MLDITKPVKMGDKLLILATSPATGYFFDKESIRQQFEGYDIAFLNKMILCSEEETHLYRPKYFVFMDGIFYDDDFNGKGTVNERKKAVEAALEKIDWECYVVVPILASFNVKNPNVKYIKLGVFSRHYSPIMRWLYSRNIANTGHNTVVMGALYFGITFGYKNIGILGFSYSPGRIYMDEDGLHEIEYMHYYDTEEHEIFVPNEKIFVNGENFLLRRAKRAIVSNQILCDLAKYAGDMGVEVINYTPENMVDVFRTKRLNIE